MRVQSGRSVLRRDRERLRAQVAQVHLADRVGRKWVFMAGLAAFAAGSAWAAFSGAVSMLIAARARMGVGAALVRACLEEAARLSVRRVFALTYRPGFFEKLGFHVIDKRELPQKIWKDCVKCAKFACCDEMALICDTEGRGQ